MEGARSRQVDDKYWQITAKYGGTPPDQFLLPVKPRILTI